MVWGNEDTIGLGSMILGILIFIGARYVIFFSIPLGFFIIGIIIQTLGIVAVVKDSNLGIGGFIFGTLYILAGIFYSMPSRIMML